MILSVWFDGGSNAEGAYGSYQINTTVFRVSFGKGTNNEAEYCTLLSALERIITRAEQKGVAPFDIDLIIYGDSELVRNQIGKMYSDGMNLEWKGWKVNALHLLPLRDKARALLYQFRSFTYHHLPREEIVKILGH